jgi:NAD(P)-dependent dehydrogenase (short-subunit alcohol dehydrogenase family)
MKKILITGGNGDMAQAIYHRLSKLYSVKVPSRNELDVSNIESVNSYFSDKNFDIVINAAGTLYSSSIIDSDPELWIRDVNVNLIGVYLVSRLAIQSNEDVRIINMSSTAAFNSYSDWTSYCASKAGVLKISMGMVKDGYDIVMMCPGAINTKIRDGLKIDNPNVMTIQEGIEPVINAVNGDYQSGEVIFYRKGTQNIIRQSDVL